MTVTVRSLLEIPDTGLKLLAGGAGLDAEVRWVHVSDVVDPTPWLTGGEFVLTTAVRLDSARVRVEFVEKLRSHGIVGLGFGIGDKPWMHSEVPAEMREAADRLGLPLIEVPFDLPFIVIAEFVASKQAEESFRETQRAYRVQQQFTQIALTEDAIGGLTRRLAELINGRAAILLSKGQTLASYPTTAERPDAGIVADLERVRETGTVASISEQGGEHVTIHPLGAPGRVRGMLVLRQSTNPGTFERRIVTSAISLLSFVLEQRLQLSPQRMAASNLLGETLLHPSTPREQYLRAAAGLGIHPGVGLTVARIWVPSEEPESVMRVLHDAFSSPSETIVVVQDRVAPGTYSLITPSGSGSDHEFDRLPELFANTQLLAGISEPVTLSRLRLAHNQAALALSRAQRHGEASVMRFRDMQYYDRIVGLAPPATIATFVATALSPLEQVEPRERSEVLLETLRAFLANHGRWEPAARSLGIHRQTLIKRISRIERTLEVDLESADIRMGLWFALAARDASHGSE